MSFSLYFSGVYFTSIGPTEHNQKSVLLNNFDDNGWVVRGKNFWAKLEWVIKVEMNINEVTEVAAKGRDVYLYDGDVHLSKYNYDIYKNPYA